MTDPDPIDLNDEPEVEIRPYACPTCEKLIIFELVDEERYQAYVCPKCESDMTLLTKQTIGKYTTCTVPTCGFYLSTVAAGDTDERCEGKRSDKKTKCLKVLHTLTMDDAADYIYDAKPEGDEDMPGAVRRLRARVAAAKSFVAGSGTHHRTKPGAHTSADREKHSAASGSKAKVRNYYIAQLEEAIAGVRDLQNAGTYSKVVNEAKSTIGAVQSK